MAKVNFIFIFLFSIVCYGNAKSNLVTQQKQYKVVLLFNGSEVSTSTSNSIEGYQQKGFNIAIDELKSNPIEYHWLDVGESVEKILTSFDKIKAIDPDLIIGPSHSSQAMALLQKMSEHKMLSRVVSPAATSDVLLKYKNIFLMSNTNSMQSKILVESIPLGKKTLIVKIEDCLYCSDFSENLIKNLKLKGITPVVHPILSEQIDGLNVSNIKMDFDFILIPGLEIEVAKLVKKIFPSHPKAVFLSGDGVGSMARYFSFNGVTKVKFKWLSHYHFSISNPSNDKFVKLYKKKYSELPNDTAAFYYESLIFGIRKYLLNELKNTYQSLTGLSRINSSFLIRPMPILKLTKDGPIVEKVQYQ